jgi:Uma2 family endonuclease
MTAMTEPIGLAEGRPFTVHDLEAMPDDGRRYELIDGMLLVTPAPGWSHQEMSLTMYTVLRAACPPELHVLAAPFAVRTALTTEVQPDVLVARYADLTEAGLPVAPVLAVETLSRSTQLNDRNTKKAHYERLGVPSYWLLDPVQPGGLEVYELDEQGRYQLTATVSGDEVFTARRPFPVQVCPARLLDGLRPR